MENLAIILAAAGASRRFGRGDKLLADLGGMPVLAYSIRELYAAAMPGGFIIAAPQEKLEDYRAAVARVLPKITDIVWVAGGAVRAQSVRNALARVPQNCELVAVHDAARPLASRQLLERVAAAARQHGGAIPGKPVTDTLKRADASGQVAATVDREGLWGVETPQVFAVEKLRRAYENAGDPTDEAGAFERAGFPVALVADAEINLKLTTPSDLEMLRALLLRR